MKIQLPKVAGKALGIKPDKEGFYFAHENEGLTVKKLAYIMAAHALELKILYEQKIEDALNEHRNING